MRPSSSSPQYIYIYTAGYQHNGLLATRALGHMMYGYTLLVPVNQSVFNKLGKERNVTGHLSALRHREC